jgi:starch phosphorylase
MGREQPSGQAQRGSTSDTKAGGIIARLDALARNLLWTWDSEAQRLFAALDPVWWEATGHNPVRTLALASPDRSELLQRDAGFLRALAACERRFQRYGRARTWFAKAAPALWRAAGLGRRQARRSAGLRVAYFSAEFALHECLPQYAGGLGVLAGDHLKGASDLGVPLVGVGLLYRNGYYQQAFDSAGQTLVTYPRLDFESLPLRDTQRTVQVPLGRATLHARIWQAQVGRTPLYLLDSDVRANPPRLRAITAQLYGGDQTTRLQQEILLGMGGVRALGEVGWRPTVYHLNEGHAAFCTLERLRSLRARGHSLATAMRVVHASTVFTTHTPVPAGHDRFERRALRPCLAGIAEQLGQPLEALLRLGREDPDNPREPLCMTVLALRLSRHRNAVSRLHGETTRRMWMSVFGASSPRQVPITHVTNGVHSRTWQVPEAAALCRRYLGWGQDLSGPRESDWERAERIPPEAFWALRGSLRRQLVQFVRARLVRQAERRLGATAALVAAHNALDDDALTIGFARRFATYKRAALIFRDPRRLGKLLGDARRPVQIIFAGKAHPRDLPGQALARKVFEFAEHPTLRGRIVLLEDYDMEVGRMLTSGCDVWLNTPLRPHEASGTSGMKPPLQGGLNLSILDGWWPEAYDGRNGWAIRGVRRGGPVGQDRADADALYELLERRVVPLFYRRDKAGVPRGWCRMMAASMRSVCGRFSAQRMLEDYLRMLYLPAHAGAAPARL